MHQRTGNTHHLNQSANRTDNGSSTAVNIMSVEAALPTLSARGKGKAGRSTGITLACVVLFSAAVFFIRKHITRSSITHLQQQQQQQQEPPEVVQNQLFSAAEYASWSGQQWQLDYDNGLVPGAADHPTPQRSLLVQTEGGNATSTAYFVPAVGGGGGGGGNVVYAIPMESGAGAGTTDSNARPETIYAVPAYAPKQFLIAAAGYVAGSEIVQGSPDTPAANGTAICAVAAEGRGENREAIRKMTFGQTDSSA